MDCAHLYRKAYQLAFQAHLGQVDKAGEPYFKHVEAVSDSVTDANEKVAALLHDIVEDTEWTLADLLQAGFPVCIVQCVDCLTRRRREKLKHYYKRILSNEWACDIKIADLTHNMRLDRLSVITDADIARNCCYEKCLKCLKERDIRYLDS